MKGTCLELREIQEIYILQYYMKRSTLRTEDWKSKALLQLLLLHWRVKRNPVKNVDNLFPTTKGKNIVCLFKKNVTTWQLGVRVEEKRNGRERKSFFLFNPWHLQAKRRLRSPSSFKKRWASVRYLSPFWCVAITSRLLLRKWLLDAVFSTTSFLKTVGTP